MSFATAARFRGRFPWVLGSLLILSLLVGSGCAKKGSEATADPLLRGRAALARGDLTRAVALLDKAVKRAPRDVRARETLATALDRAGRLRRAEGVLRDGIALLPKSAALWIALGRVLQKRGKYDRAVNALDRAQRLAPRDPEPALLLGELYERYRKWDVARSHYRAVLARSERSEHRVLAHRYLARLARRRHLVDEAIDHLRQAVRLAPREAVLYGELGEALRSAGRPAEALKVLGKQVELRPRDGRARLRLGLTKQELGDHAAAVKELRQAARLLPRSVEPLLPLAQSLRALGRDVKAYTVGVKALALAPGDPAVQWLMAPLYVKRGLYTPAAELVKKLREARSHDSAYWELAGDVRTAEGDHREARQDYARALTLRPRESRLLRKVAFAARRSGDYKTAEQRLAKLVALDPQDYDAGIHLAIAEAQLGRRARARARLRRLSVARPKRPLAHLYLGWLVLQGGGAKRALELASRADRLAEGKSAHALDVMLSALLKLGRRADAEKVAQRALALPLAPGSRKYFLKRLAPLKKKPR